MGTIISLLTSSEDSGVNHLTRDSSRFFHSKRLDIHPPANRNRPRPKGFRYKTPSNAPLEHRNPQPHQTYPPAPIEPPAETPEPNTPV
jgi:hypothetical protein